MFYAFYSKIFDMPRIKCYNSTMELSSRLLRQARIEREYTVMKKALNKKAISVLIAAVILLVAAFPVLAAEPFKLSSSAEAKDSVVTVKIYLPQNTELGTLSFTLKYDTKLLTYVSAEYSSGDVSATNSSTAGEVKINAVWKDTAPLGGEVAAVTFKVNDGATGKTDFPINVDFSTDANNQHIDLSAVSAFVDLSEAAPVPAADETVSTEGKNVKAGRIPKTYGKYAAIGSAAAALCVAAAAVAVTVKRKRK